MAATHTYRTALAWQGSTAAGYRDYPREHDVTADPATAGLRLSADPHFRGDAQHLNPEQLLVAAASSCQLLAYLAEAARAGIDVLDYRDDAEGVMPATRDRMRLTRIVLRPHIVVAAGTDLGAAQALVEPAHEGCYVANSLSTEVVVEPTITLA